MSWKEGPGPCRKKTLNDKATQHMRDVHLVACHEGLLCTECVRGKCTLTHRHAQTEKPHEAGSTAGIIISRR
jgi:hypothetical protein